MNRSCITGNKHRTDNIFRMLVFCIVFFEMTCTIASDANSFQNKNAVYKGPPPFWENTHGIEVATPEEGLYYTLAGLHFNSAITDFPYFQILVSTTPLINDGTNITNIAFAVAAANSIISTGNPGYLLPSDFYLMNNGLITTNPFPFPSGRYYFVILGFDAAGNLSYSSPQIMFNIY